MRRLHTVVERAHRTSSSMCDPIKRDNLFDINFSHPKMKLAAGCGDTHL